MKKVAILISFFYSIPFKPNLKNKYWKTNIFYLKKFDTKIEVAHV